MRYRLLGNSGLRVSEAALGTMTFGDDWGWGAAKGEGRKVSDSFREAGGNFIDTANVYTNGTRPGLTDFDECRPGSCRRWNRATSRANIFSPIRSGSPSHSTGAVILCVSFHTLA
jgi:Aldo/keto reductase family